MEGVGGLHLKKKKKRTKKDPLLGHRTTHEKTCFSGTKNSLKGTPDLNGQES